MFTSEYYTINNFKLGEMCVEELLSEKTDKHWEPANMNKFEIKKKLQTLILDMLTSDDYNYEIIPEALGDFILENYGWIVSEKINSTDDMHKFIKSLEEWIEKNYLTSCPTNNDSIEEVYNLREYNEKYLEAEFEYSQVTSDLIKALEEAITHKEKFSEFFKNKCRAQDTELDILLAKAQFVKLQFFFKLYGEENVLVGHLALQKKLRKELEALKRNYKEASQLNIKYENVSNDQNYCKLFNTYKKLLKIKKKSEIIKSI